jgi:hypothetical protein
MKLEELLKGDLAKLAVGLALGLAIFDLAKANSFASSSSDFLYGIVIEAVLVLALLGALAYFLFSARRDRRNQ